MVVGEHELTGTLFVDKPPNFSETSGGLTLKGPSINELSGFLGLEYEFLERGYEGSFVLKGTRQALILDSLEIIVGESDLSGWGSLQNTQPPTFELELKSKAMYLPLIEPELIANGEVDLLSEKFYLSLVTKPRTGMGISPAKVIAPRLTVKGTLAKPSFSVDSKSTAISTYAAFISGGASLLATSLWDRATRSKDPCHDLYKLALKEIQPDPMTRK
jgi:hypothetical protein